MTDIFSYQLEILKKELEHIESSIRKIDDLSNNTKNWSILVWTGALAIFLKDHQLHPYIWLTSVPPLVFMILDASWRKIQRKLFYRQREISIYLNSENFEKDFQSRKMNNFAILNPLSSRSFLLDHPSIPNSSTKIKPYQTEEIEDYTNLKRILSYPTIFWIYLSLSSLSFLLCLIILIF